MFPSGCSTIILLKQKIRIIEKVKIKLPNIMEPQDKIRKLGKVKSFFFQTINLDLIFDKHSTEDLNLRYKKNSEKNI